MRILFCTETFAVGVNAPARTVVFSAMRKWDGSSNRQLDPGEYVQMAGRAGRRGKDTVGTVILYMAPADFPSELEVKAMLTGATKQMKSQFRLTYNMILNLMRVDELRVEDVMSRSFSEAPAGRDSKRWNKLVTSGQAQLKLLESRSFELDRYRDLHRMFIRFRALSESISPALSSLKISATAAFDIGRIVLVCREGFGFSVGAIIRSTFRQQAKLGLKVPPPGGVTSSLSAESPCICRLAVLRGGPFVADSKSPFLELNVTAHGRTDSYDIGGLVVDVRNVTGLEIASFSSMKAKLDERGLNPLRGPLKQESLSDLGEQLHRIADDKVNWHGLPLLRWEDSGLKDIALAEVWLERNNILENMCRVLERHASSSSSHVSLAHVMQELDKELKLRGKLSELQVAASDDSLQLMPDFRQRIEVLTALGYISDGNVLLKGRAMCEVNCCELILVELCFENVLQKMTSRSMTALLSALVYQGSIDNFEEGNAGMDRFKTISEDLHEGALALTRILLSIGGVQAECRLPVSPIDYVQSQANFGLVEAVYVWAGGEPFTTVCQTVPDVAEGTIVRTIVRLSELLRETRSVGRVIGDPVLQDAAEEGTNLIKRDVIFAASLYVT